MEFSIPLWRKIDRGLTSFRMLKNKKLAVILIISITLPGLAGGSYFLWEYFSTRSMDPMSAVPVDASAIFTTKRPDVLWEKLNKESEVWQTFSMTGGLSQLNDALKSIDSALRMNSDYQDFLGKTSIVLSIHAISPGKNVFLFIQKLPLPFSEPMLHRFLNKYGKEQSAESIRYRSCKIRANIFGKKSIKVWHTFYKGLFIAAFEPETIKRSIDQIKDSPAVNLQKEFVLVNSTSGKTTPGNVFVQFENMPAVLSAFSARHFSTGFGKLGNFARWAGLDLLVQSDKLIFSGYTHAQGTDFLKLFSNQKPAFPQALSILPSKTASFACMSFDDYRHFIDQYNNYLADIYKSENNQPANAALSASVLENLKQAGITEITVALVNSGYSTALENTLVIVRSKNQALFSQMLTETLPSNKRNNKITINGREFGHAGFKQFFGNFMFNILPDFEETYYYTVGDNFIFCPSADNLYKIISSYLSGSTLINDRGFSSLMQSLNEKSNIFLYYHPERSAAFHHFLFEDITAGNLDSQLPSLAAMDGLAIQFSTEGNRFYSTIIIKKAIPTVVSATASALEGLVPEDSLIENPETEGDYPDVSTVMPQDTLPDMRAAWTYITENPIVGQPVILGRGNKKVVMITDTQNQIYCLDDGGKLKWKIRSDNAVIGLIQEADILGTGQTGIVFNTADKLWALDFNGQVYKNYPVNLPEQAMNSVAIIRSRKSRTTSVYYCSKDNAVVCLDKQGRELKSWSKPKADNAVKNQILYFSTAEGEFLLIPMIDGHIMICGMDGSIKSESSSSFVNSNNSEIYLNATNSKGVMLTTDEKGNLTYVNPSGPVEKTVFDNFSNKHFFLYDDFDGNGGKDFIYIDDRVLIVYDRFKTVLLKHSFTGAIKIKPLILEVGKKKYLAVLDHTAGGISLIDLHGLVNAEPYRASLPFTAGSMGASKELYLITASGSRIYSYPIK